MGFFQNIGTENEVRKLISRVSPNGFGAGWRMPSLSEMGQTYPSAQRFRQQGQEAGWRSRDIAVGIVVGIYFDIRARAEASGDQAALAASIDLFKGIMDAVHRNSEWYSQENFRTVLHWTQKLK
ncbi:hypothetical protein [Blastochloris tepida]|uniref:Uncharacterized protein n=1 Tax=Blastochloris tepida TaxID=2233851 RepID=A0A348FXX2_9HYPH|nr:hypothetical protein [Blastochloris tepida]BBF92155.1 hypothetical protein BLTE_08400 [Blastochloris tepida]